MKGNAMSKFAKLICATTAGLALGAGSAIAAEKTANLGVSASVLDTCILTAPIPLTFGTLDASSDTTQTTPGQIAVTCTAAKTGVTITLGGGGAASSGLRHMSDLAGENTLPYRLYSDATHEDEVAVDGTVYNGDISAVLELPISVYGKIPAGSYATGAYSDTVLVTLTY